MAKRKVQLGVTVVVADPETSKPEMRDSLGNVVAAGTVGTRSIAPGEWVELEEEEAARLEARFPYQTYDALREADAASKKAEATIGGRRVSTSSRRG